MMGSASDPGIIPRICEALFYLINNHGTDVSVAGVEFDSTIFSVEASYLEIYNEVYNLTKCFKVYMYNQ